MSYFMFIGKIITKQEEKLCLDPLGPLLDLGLLVRAKGIRETVEYVESPQPSPRWPCRQLR